MYDGLTLEQSFLRAEGLVLEVDGKRLIDIPKLSLAHNGITVLMGPNGAGKSLLLRLLHGLQEPSSGRVILNTHQQAQAMVFQSPVLLRRTAEANLRFARRTQKLSLDALPELLDRVRLSDKARTPARRLSGGERQRLAIAQALATEPEVLLLDEPTASLDPSATALIEDILLQTARRGVRIVLVTHDVLQARRIAEDVVFLSQGRVVEHELSKTFFDRPKTDMARAYLAGRLLA